MSSRELFPTQRPYSGRLLQLGPFPQHIALEWGDGRTLKQVLKSIADAAELISQLGFFVPVRRDA
jgi:hypothetical protein